jgi:hypothetical protein
LKRKLMVFDPAWMLPAGRLMVIFKVLNPPPIPPYPLAFPNTVTVLSLMGIQAELFTCTLAWVSKRNPWICIHRFSGPLRFAPLGMVIEVVTAVPLGPITSTGSVSGPDGPLEAGVRVTVAVAVLVGSATLAAVMVTVCWLEIVAGAVYTPFAMVPAAGLSDQVTALLPVPVTEALKVADAATPSDTEAGPIVTPTGVRDTRALAVLVESAALVAVTVTVCGVAITAGA